MEDKQKAFEQLVANARQWQEFAGIKNSDDCVLRKASALSRVLVSEHAVWSVESLQSHGVSLGISKNDRRWWNVYYDFLLYYMHIADREALELLGEKRSIFMDRLDGEVTEFCAMDFGDDKKVAQFKAKFFENLNLFQNEFASYKRGAAVPLGEQLQYRFGKRIASRFGLGTSFNLLVVVAINASEIVLNIPGLLTGKSRKKGKGM